MKCLICVADQTERMPFQLGLLGTNCRCRASRVRALGWEPKYTVEDFIKGVRGDVEAQLKAAPSA